MSETYIAPKALRQCIRCNNFWPSCQPYFPPDSDSCGVCQPKTRISSHTANTRYTQKRKQQQNDTQET